MLSYRDRFLDYLKFVRGAAMHTIEAYRRDLEDFEAFMRDSELREENELVLGDLRAYVARSSHQGLSARSINRRLSALRSYARYVDRNLRREEGQNRGFAMLDLLENLRGLKTRRSLPGFFFEEEISTLLELKGDAIQEGFQAVRDRAVFEFFYSTGVRVSELASISPSDIEFSRSRAKVLGKGNRERYVFLGRQAMQALEVYMSLAREVLGKGVFEAKEGLFKNLRGQALSVRGIQYILGKRLAQLGLEKNVGPHGLRHSFATHIMNRGADIRVVQELLGHQQLSTTQVYTHLNIQKLRETYAQAHPHGASRRKEKDADE